MTVRILVHTQLFTKDIWPLTRPESWTALLVVGGLVLGALMLALLEEGAL